MTVCATFTWGGTLIKRMLFIFNPNTGGGRLRSQLMPMLCHFAGAGYELTVCPTTAQGDARRYAREKASLHDITVCCGGDGTLNEVVDGIQGIDPTPLLGYIPGGTTNDFASSLKLPRSNMMAATRRVLQPRKVYKCDVGLFNERAFVYVAAFGAFTDVTYSTPQNFKNILGYFAYILEAVPRLANLPSHRIRLETEDTVVEDDFIFGMVSNSTSVGGLSLLPKEKVHMDDGLFEVLLLRNPHNITGLRALSVALLSHDEESDCIVSLQARQMRITAESPIPWTLDGEYGGEVEQAAFSVRQKAVHICI